MQGGGETTTREDEDDVASVNSDRSALSFSSEVSINPYTKYTQPVQVCCSGVVLLSRYTSLVSSMAVTELHVSFAALVH